MPTITLLAFASGHLYASTSDRGLFISGSPEGVRNIASSGFSISAFPQPTSGMVSVKMHLSSDENVHIELLDVASRVVRKYSERELSKGEHTITLQPDLPSGSYWLRLITRDAIQQLPIVIAR